MGFALRSNFSFPPTQGSIFFWLFVICLLSGCIDKPSAHRLFTDLMEISVEQVPNGDRLEITGLAVDSKGRIYCCDSKNSRVLCFASDGSYLRDIGRRDRRSGEIAYPSGLATDREDNLYVACFNSVLVFNSDGKRIRRFGIDFKAQAIAVDSVGNVYLSGYRPGGAVHKYNPQWKLVKSFGETFQHDHVRLRKRYSGGTLIIEGNRLYMSYITPYKIAVFDLDGEVIDLFQRPELDFRPRFEVKEKGYAFRTASRGVNICFVDGHILDAFHLLEKGWFLDICDVQNGPVLKDISFDAYLLASDREGNIFYIPERRPGSSIYRGRLIAQDRISTEAKRPSEN